MKYRRKEPCSVCGQDYFIDTTAKIGWCVCGIVNIIPPPDYLLRLAFEVWNPPTPKLMTQEKWLEQLRRQQAE